MLGRVKDFQSITKILAPAKPWLCCEYQTSKSQREQSELRQYDTLFALYPRFLIILSLESPKTIPLTLRF